MAQFDSVGAGLARGLTRGFAIRGEREDRQAEEDRKIAEAQQKRQDAFRTGIENARKSTEEGFEKQLEELKNLGEQGASPDQLKELSAGASSLVKNFADIMDFWKGKFIEAGGDPALTQQWDSEQFRSLHEQRLNATIQGAAISQEAQQVETLTPEQVQELSPELPEGSIIQKNADGKINMVFTPGGDPSALQEKFKFLTDGAGIEPGIAAGIVGGQFSITLDPITREAFVIDISTGERVGDVPPPANVADAEGVVESGVNPSEAVGLQGFGANVLNTISDAIGLGAPAKENLEATTAMNVVQQQTKLLMQAVVPGRPAKDIREGLALLTVTPNSIFQGEARAKSRFESTKRWLDNEITRIEKMLAGKVSPTDRGTLNNNLGPLKEMSRSYQTLIDAFDKDDEVDPQLEADIEEFGGN